MFDAINLLAFFLLLLTDLAALFKVVKSLLLLHEVVVSNLVSNIQK